MKGNSKCWLLLKKSKTCLNAKCGEKEESEPQQEEKPEDKTQEQTGNSEEGDSN